VLAIEVADEDGHGRGEEGLEEGRVEVDDGEDPVERVDNHPDDLKDQIEVLPVPADDNHVVLGQDIVDNLYNLQQTISLNGSLYAVELVGNVVVLIRIDEL
jgi:hypothetical protein